MKAAAGLGSFLGLLALIGIALHEDIPAIGAAFMRAGWVLLWLIPVHAAPLLLDVLGWRTLIAAPIRISELFVIASIREAINRLLPVANIGGEIVGIRLLTKQGVAASVAASTVIVETVLNLIAQYVFIAIGALCLLQLTDSMHILSIAGLGLAASLPMLVLIVIGLHRGAFFAQVERLVARLFKKLALGVRLEVYGLLLDAAVSRLLRSPSVLLKSCAWQLAGYLVGVIETWAALKWLGHPVGFATATALESLTQAARSVVFLIPAGLGVQELSLLAVGSILGVDSTTALSLSLAKRMRELLFGLPSLVAWSWMDLAPALLRRQ